MTRADEDRINAIATARSVKAVRILVGLLVTRPDDVPIAELPAMVRGLSARDRDRVVRAVDIKAASRDTWKVVESAADLYAELDVEMEASSDGD